MNFQNKNIIAITGFKGNGKDTLGKIINKKHEYEIVKFAEPIKRVISYLYNIDFEKWEYLEFKNTKSIIYNNNSPRDLLITLGTDCFRKIDSLVWCRFLIRKIKQNKDKKYIITDLRFLNEYHYLKNLKAYIIYIEKPGYVPKWINYLTWLFGVNEFSRFIVYLINKDIGNKTEFYILELKKKANLVIYNDSSIEDLENKINKLIK